MIRNYTEINAEHTLKDLLERPEFADTCTCEHCIDDIMAISLNNLKPKYITTRTGEVFSEYEMKDYQYLNDIKTEVVRALEKVRANCKHEPNQR